MYKDAINSREFANGDAAQKEFRSFIEQQGISYSYDRNSDIKHHVDFTLYIGGKVITTDVKSNKFRKDGDRPKMGCFEMSVDLNYYRTHFNAPNAVLKTSSSKETDLSHDMDFLCFMIDHQPYFLSRKGLEKNLQMKVIEQLVNGDWKSVMHPKGEVDYASKKAYHLYENQNKENAVLLVYVPLEDVKDKFRTFEELNKKCENNLHNR